jgi:hypothetical protein
VCFYNNKEVLLHVSASDAHCCQLHNQIKHEEKRDNNTKGKQK